MNFTERLYFDLHCHRPASKLEVLSHNLLLYTDLQSPAPQFYFFRFLDLEYHPNSAKYIFLSSLFASCPLLHASHDIQKCADNSFSWPNLVFLNHIFYHFVITLWSLQLDLRSCPQFHQFHLDPRILLLRSLWAPNLSKDDCIPLPNICIWRPFLLWHN